ncbi:hypothetical protein NQ315_014459 [Exocentrus adspersus]|uniref:Uncharacterized protein n=1 Tax=Exocentrus adspersus TaxID=1586481 RepID=A0AAV8V8F9_9CUCU|nr:hypothetical protein NQ315_014459 [Exocentrus adspersus]
MNSTPYHSALAEKEPLITVYEQFDSYRYRDAHAMLFDSEFTAMLAEASPPLALSLSHTYGSPGVYSVTAVGRVHRSISKV